MSGRELQAPLSDLPRPAPLGSTDVGPRQARGRDIDGCLLETVEITQLDESKLIGMKLRF